ncbi:MAG: hypothetical protein MJ072_02940, partial [Clostridia bacterium]|nr:hypothetical protein [Clostridia bacterium]
MFKDSGLIWEDFITVFGDKTFTKPGVYTCEFVDFSSRNYKDIPIAGAITVKVEKTEMPIEVQEEAANALTTGRTDSYTIFDVESETASFISAMALVKSFNERFGELANIGSLTYDVGSTTGIAVTEDMGSLPAGNKTIRFGNFTSGYFYVELSSVWNVVEDITLEDIRKIFTAELTVTTSDDLIKTETDFMNGIKAAHPDFLFEYHEYRDSRPFADSDKVTFGDNVYYKEGVYTCVFYELDSKFYSGTGDFGTLTVNVEKTDIPDGLKGEMETTLKNGNLLTLTGTTLDKEGEFFASAIDTYIEFNEKYHEIAHIGTLTYETALMQGIAVTPEMGTLPAGNKTIYFGSIRSEIFNLDISSTWYIVDKGNVPDEIKELFTGSSTLKSTDDIGSLFTEYLEEIQTAHPDFTCEIVIKKDGRAYADSDVISYGGKNYYKAGVYTCDFTDFNSNDYKDIPVVGTLTVTVEKADIPDGLKAEMTELLNADNAYEITGNSTTEQEVQFFKDALAVFAEFNSKYGAVVQIGSVTYEADLETGVFTVTEDISDLPKGNKTITFSDV